jgi:SOS-response transcriptional repressor LexA
VPLVATVSAGSGIEIFETYEKVRQIPEYYWKAGARAVFKVRGHSMLDMGITENDLLFVRPTTRPKTGDVVICSLNGSAFVKEFERTKTGVRLVSHSDEYQPMEVSEADDLRVFGIVVGRTGDLTGNRRRRQQ